MSDNIADRLATMGKPVRHDPGLGPEDIPASITVPVIIENEMRMRLRSPLATFDAHDGTPELVLMCAGSRITLEQDDTPTVVLSLQDLFAAMHKAREDALNALVREGEQEAHP